MFLKASASSAAACIRHVISKEKMNPVVAHAATLCCAVP